MIPEKGKVKYLVECRCCHRREELFEKLNTSYLETVLMIRRLHEGLRILDHNDIAPERGCGELAVFDIVAIGREPETE